VLGLKQLERLDAFNRRRTELAMRYRQRLSGIAEILPLSDPPYHVKHSWHLFIVRLDTEKAGMTRETFMKELKQRNIGTGIHFLAAHVQKYYRERLGIKAEMLRDTEWNSERICSLPLFPEMRDRDADDVAEAVRDVLKGKP